MELDLDEGLAADLAAEADQHGFDSPEAYAIWLLRHRAAVLNPPQDRLLGHLERLEGEVDKMRAVIEAEHSSEAAGTTTATAWFDTSAEDGGPASSGDSDDTAFEFGGQADEEQPEDRGVSEFAYSSDLEPPGGAPSPDDAESGSTDESGSEQLPEEGADDDEIADAIADIDLAEDEERSGEERNGER